MTVTQENSVEGLFAALVGDGFTVACFGPKKAPVALVAYYEWDDYFDVVTVPQYGPAAAARLAKPAAVLDPPPTAVWTWVGEPEGAIWALLRLAHPDHPDAPAEVVATPDVLRVPPLLHRNMTLRKPPSGRDGVRATRLRQAREQQDISREFFRELFFQVDSFASAAVGENFTDEAELQFGNFPPMVGPTAIAGFVDTLAAMVTGVRHRIDNFWELSDKTAFTVGTVTFTRHDGTELTVPFATVSFFNHDCALLVRHQVFVNASDI